jgi:hypothetical protein
VFEVQAGTTGSAANIRIDADSREALLRGLETLRTALAEANELGSVQKGELKEVIADCEHEVAQETPNRSRLLGSLQAMEAVVQTTASLQPAWEAIRRALQLMGIGL